MPLRADIEAIYADDALDDARKREAIYRLKTRALIDVINRYRMVDSPYTHNGVSYLIHEVMAGPADQLIFDITINDTKHTIVIVNPPLIPRAPIGHEVADMRQAVVEMLEGFG